MIPAAHQQGGDDAVVKRRPHLVVKRGHRGRFRFALITEGRLTGEVVVEDDGGDHDVSRARAISKIVTLAQSFSGALVVDHVVAPTKTIARRGPGPGGYLGEI